MDLELEKIVSYIVALALGGLWTQAVRIFKDLNASFGKIRDLEKRLDKLEGKRHGTREEEI